MTALSALLLAACEPPFERIAPPTSRLLVHAVMDLGANDQVILIERTEPDPVKGLQVTGATVTITTPTTTRQAQEEPPRQVGEPEAYRVAMSNGLLGFGPGATIALRIVTREGDTISGTTTMPNALPGAPPVFGATRFNRDVDTLRISWPRVPGARGYEVGIYAIDTFIVPGGEVVQSRSLHRVFTDTSITIPGTAESVESGERAFPRGERITVVVSAVDDNYLTYYRPKVDPLAGAPPSRLSGALGVFGSIVPLQYRVYDVR